MPPKQAVKKAKPAAAKKAPAAKKAKDPNMPKRGANAYFLYMNANREAIKKANPDIKFTEISGVASTQYKALKGKEAQKWQDAAAADKARYEKEKTKYEKTAESKAWRAENA